MHTVGWLWVVRVPVHSKHESNGGERKQVSGCPCLNVASQRRSKGRDPRMSCICGLPLLPVTSCLTSARVSDVFKAQLRMFAMY